MKLPEIFQPEIANRQTTRLPATSESLPLKLPQTWRARAELISQNTLRHFIVAIPNHPNQGTYQMNWTANDKPIESVETIVIFRKDRTGWKDCFALFPELPSDEHGRLCTAYQHVGQHSAADYYGCIAQSDPATPAEYADLLKELKRMGYILNVSNHKETYQ